MISRRLQSKQNCYVVLRLFVMLSHLFGMISIFKTLWIKLQHFSSIVAKKNRNEN